MKTLYNISFVIQYGYRQLLGPNQGRCFSETREAAETKLAAMLGDGNRERLESIYGKERVATFRVDYFECYDHGDAIGIYVGRLRRSNKRKKGF